jgi:hypothetical protein
LTRQGAARLIGTLSNAPWKDRPLNLQTKPQAARPIFPVGRSTIEKSHIETIAAGRLYALQNVLELDGRVSAYPPMREAIRSPTAI